jgi:dihydrofolate reductase
MQKVRVAGFSLSLDGFGAGPEQSVHDPLGKGGLALHEWLFRTRAHQAEAGGSGGSEGVDDRFVAQSLAEFGAIIVGRKNFGPKRGEWSADRWRGWWGENPPFHAPVFVLTHYPRDPITMEGGTTFHFVTEGSEAALDLAKSTAGKRDVRILGGVATVREYLQAGAIDMLHLAIVPAVLGRGEALFAGLDLVKLGFRVTEHAAGENATHVVLSK